MPDDHFNAIHRAGRKAQIATRTFGFNHRMHLSRRAEDCIHRAGLDAKRAANASQFINDRHCFRLFLAVIGIESFGLDTKKIRQRLDLVFPAWRALVDIGLTAGNRFGIGSAPREVALAALGLRQDRFNLIRYRVGINVKSASGPAEPKTKQAAKDRY